MREWHLSRSPSVHHIPGRSAGCKPKTVASLGMRVRLVPADLDRDRQLSDLIASCELLRAEWERLFQLIVAHLNEDHH
jgi:hypothetical protein